MRKEEMFKMTSARLVKENAEDLEIKTKVYQKCLPHIYPDFNKADEAHMKDVMKTNIKEEQENTLGATGKTDKFKREIEELKAKLDNLCEGVKAKDSENVNLRARRDELMRQVNEKL